MYADTAAHAGRLCASFRKWTFLNRPTSLGHCSARGSLRIVWNEVLRGVVGRTGPGRSP